MDQRRGAWSGNFRKGGGGGVNLCSAEKAETMVRLSEEFTPPQYSTFRKYYNDLNCDHSTSQAAVKFKDQP